MADGSGRSTTVQICTRADVDCCSGFEVGRRGRTNLGPDGRRRLMGFRDAEPVGDDGVSSLLTMRATGRSNGQIWAYLDLGRRSAGRCCDDDGLRSKPLDVDGNGRPKRSAALGLAGRCRTDLDLRATTDDRYGLAV
ncbi:hypothetical protein ACLOJK_026745 [Asimina triloba]